MADGYRQTRVERKGEPSGLPFLLILDYKQAPSGSQTYQGSVSPLLGVCP